MGSITRRDVIIILGFLIAGTTGVSRAADKSLETALSEVLSSSTVRQSTVSLQIVEMSSGKVVGSRDASRTVVPASNMKLFTTAAGLDLLTPSFEFRTTLSIRGEVDSTGVLRGDVRITGRGDPTIGTRFHDGNATRVIEEWVDALATEGIHTIDGNVILEYGYFDDEWVHPTWPEDQLVHWYEAPVAALVIEEGCVTVRVSPAEPGGTARVEMIPANSLVRIENSCKTSSRGRGIVVARKNGENSIVVTGNIKPGAWTFETPVSVVFPVHFFANVVEETFEREGLTVTGKTLLVARDGRSGWRTVTEHRTPLTLVTYVINKKSQNHYAEQLIKTVGAEKYSEGSWTAGTLAVARWAHDAVGIPTEQLRQVDGSGMSRDNRVSADAFVRLLRYMWNSPNRWTFVSSLPYTGEQDSKLRRRLGTAPYARNVYAKTGYLRGAIGLTGYVRATSGKIYAFSLLFNGYKTTPSNVYRVQDEILKTVVDKG